MQPQIFHTTPVPAVPELTGSGWEPLLSTLSNRTGIMTFVACWVSARLALRRDERLSLTDRVYGIEPGCETSFLWDCARSYLAHLDASVLRALIGSVRTVAEALEPADARALLRVARILESTPRGSEGEQIESWLHFSWACAVEPRSFLQICK